MTAIGLNYLRVVTLQVSVKAFYNQWSRFEVLIRIHKFEEKEHTFMSYNHYRFKMNGQF